MTPLERKIIRCAAEIAADSDMSCLLAISFADGNKLRFCEWELLIDKFRRFYAEPGCPFCSWQGDPEELRTIRVLLLETFLYHDGELG